MAPVQAPAHVPIPADPRQYVMDRYQNRIEYYWGASRYNKRSYKTTRYLTILLGALVTLIASISSASFIKNTAWLSVAFSVLTPVLAATLAIIGGISQAFQWGAAWADMVLTATRLEKERDRVAVMPLADFDPVKEVALLDNLVLTETQTFFQRLFGSGGTPKPDQQPAAAK